MSGIFGTIWEILVGDVPTRDEFTEVEGRLEAVEEGVQYLNTRYAVYIQEQKDQHDQRGQQ